MKELIKKVEDSMSSIFSKEDVLNLLKSMESQFVSYIPFHENINFDTLDEAKINYKPFNDDGDIYIVTADNEKSFISAIHAVELANNTAKNKEICEHMIEHVHEFVEDCLYIGKTDVKLSLNGDCIETDLDFSDVTFDVRNLHEFISGI